MHRRVLRSYDRVILMPTICQCERMDTKLYAQLARIYRLIELRWNEEEEIAHEALD